MLSIGEFASMGRVTVRLLRYYDEIGLLKPARVDPASNYRSYAPAQVPVLTRILQLRDFGIRLDDIARIIHRDLDTAAEQELLETARGQLANQIEDNTLRLQRLEAYLKTMEGRPMPATIDVDVQPIAAQRIAYLDASAAGWGNRNIGPVIGPLFGELDRALTAAGISGGPGVAIYEAEETGDETSVRVTAALVIDGRVGPGAGYKIKTLPPIGSAAIAVHRGEVATIDQSWHALMDWVTGNGYEMTGICREIYLTPGNRPQAEWVTQLVQPIGPGD
ncbi:MAG: MerR family transcriptional regulator [Microlunatus sp.]|nr:MerR family transcriptional regulator [Microlunatus sp.]